MGRVGVKTFFNLFFVKEKVCQGENIIFYQKVGDGFPSPY
jgi:hypothetical protein